jgi:hypothetical protein
VILRIGLRPAMILSRDVDQRIGSFCLEVTFDHLIGRRREELDGSTAFEQ